MTELKVEVEVVRWPRFGVQFYPSLGKLCGVEKGVSIIIKFWRINLQKLIL